MYNVRLHNLPILGAVYVGRGMSGYTRRQQDAAIFPSREAAQEVADEWEGREAVDYGVCLEASVVAAD